jgi:hypothetical protein
LRGSGCGALSPEFTPTAGLVLTDASAGDIPNRARRHGARASARDLLEASAHAGAGGVRLAEYGGLLSAEPALSAAFGHWLESHAGPRFKPWRACKAAEPQARHPAARSAPSASSAPSLSDRADWTDGGYALTVGVATKATIICPECGHASTESMPLDACKFFYPCQSCNTTLRPRSGDCCVFCSYADQMCPPKQAGQLSC